MERTRHTLYSSRAPASPTTRVPHLLRGPIVDHGDHLSSILTREIHTTGSLVQGAESLTSHPHRGGVDYGGCHKAGREEGRVRVKAPLGDSSASRTTHANPNQRSPTNTLTHKGVTASKQNTPGQHARVDATVLHTEIPSICISFYHTRNTPKHQHKASQRHPRTQFTEERDHKVIPSVMDKTSNAVDRYGCPRARATHTHSHSLCHGQNA